MSVERRINFITARPFYVSERGELMAEPGLTRLIHCLDDLCASEKMTLHVMAPTVQKQWTLGSAALKSTIPYRLLPEMPSVKASLSKILSTAAIVRRAERNALASIVQLPFAAAHALSAPACPRVYQVCADVRKVAQNNAAYTGLLRAFANGFARHLEELYVSLAKVGRVVTHGAELRELFHEAPGETMVSSALFQDELGSVKRTRSSTRFRFLYVGYMRPEKGVEVLLRAFQALAATRDDVELRIIGADTPVGHGLTGETEAYLSSATRNRRVTLEPGKPFGAELFEEYANADALVLPTFSEGTPRVLVEARAFGCPVIASDVGGIPTSVIDGETGMLVPPRNVAALVQAMHRIIDDRALRISLKRKYMDVCNEHTVESNAQTIFKQAMVSIAS